MIEFFKSHCSLMKDFVELDDDVRSVKAVSTLSAEGTKKMETSVVESKAFSSKAVTVDKTSLVSNLNRHANTELGKATDLEASVGTAVGDKKTRFTLPIAPPSNTSFHFLVPTNQRQQLIRLFLLRNKMHRRLHLVLA